MRWQRRARTAVGVFLVGFTLAVFLAIRERPSPPREEPPPPRADAAAVSETESGVTTFSLGETVTFDRALSYADGRVRLERVEVRIPEETGRVVTIRAADAVRQEAGGSEIGLVEFKGDVEVTSSDGLHLTTGEATYNAQDGLVTAPGAVRFERGRLSGSGIGASYDRARDRLWLLSDARVVVAPDAEGGGVQVDAGAAEFTRDEHRVRFERGVHIESADRLIDALGSVVTLSDDDTRVTLVELRGDSRVARRADTPPGPGDVVAMRARDMDLGYAADGVALERATLVGQAGVELAADAGDGRRIAAERLDIALDPASGVVTSLAGRDGVEVSLPGGAARPAQRISAASLDARGDAAGLRHASFAGRVEFRETPAAAPAGATPPDRLARSNRLGLDIAPGFGGVGAADFAGGVTFTDGTWRTESARARYAPAEGVLALDPGSPPSSSPRVADDRLTIDATSFEIALATKALTAKDDVQAVIRPRDPGASAGGRLPALLAGDAAVYVAAESLVYDGSASLATFGGGARLWQGDTLVQGRTVALDGSGGNLTAEGGVRTVLVLGDPGKAGAPARTVTDAGRMEYDEAGRSLTYQDAVHFLGPEGDVRADRLALTLEPEAAVLAQAEASGAVTALLENRYHVTGRRLTYLASEARYVVEGEPVRIVEERPTECLETVGTILTFARSAATIAVDGIEGSRSKTRQVPCPPRRR